MYILFSPSLPVSTSVLTPLRAAFEDLHDLPLLIPLLSFYTTVPHYPLSQPY